jgi:hypothetical protein
VGGQGDRWGYSDGGRVASSGQQVTPFSTDPRSIIPAADLATLREHAADAPTGAFVEVGVYRGGSARALYEIAEAQHRTLYLFDTFSGHPRPGEHDAPQHPEGRYADCVDPDVLQQELPNARVIVGRFPWSLYRYLLEREIGGVAFAHIDVDLYRSTCESIAALTRFLVPGGVMYFDDYGVPECMGATKAVDELCPERIVLANGKAIVRHP